ncbi:MAG: histidine--tRNA ligase [Candidatus Marinimicrobia bacterium]|jgi:histidyl-tRNA synthetase|nr:histidine--tRNA ligase [Candidatus Neomarinimicrobiota bacterium]MBT3617624.1 histidine--tRNA ligase [Candidatus Neomarinimicrobiota bacterium]MBT3829102.1 histidine--tRNA ligase [Candidatus Neomarinimicrobiota bacterium]MBT3997716.1 histidine--tRNA ligase [Candidatus Neomarinimicrobiota bacterium]MBT4281397.1 histidine--tRNA ligase [Candidatus Neomarinimicrobiota bacterium]
MPDKIQSPKGTHDILPPEARRWQVAEESIRKMMDIFGYGEIRTPVFEKSELFARGVGETSDIVSKEMYTFSDKGDTSLTLKPEITAPVIRSFIQHNLGKKSPMTKLYYIDHAFRQERPQAGRFRQFHQYGVEAIGSHQPEMDVEVISLATESLIALGLDGLTLKLNSIGETKSRKKFRKALKTFLQPHFNELSEASQKRFEVNPLRILDSKNLEEQKLLQDAPNISEFLDDNDKAHFSDVCEGLTQCGIPFELDSTLVRGLDYYTRTTFEITSTALGAQDAVCGGGRYDGLVETLGGPSTPAIGFAAGIERILLCLESKNESTADSQIQVYFIAHGDVAREIVIPLIHASRQIGVQSDFDPIRRSLKAQFREANRIGAEFAVIIGDSEIQAKEAQIKNLETGDQMSIKFDDLGGYLASLQI